MGRSHRGQSDTLVGEICGTPVDALVKRACREGMDRHAGFGKLAYFRSGIG
jgi:hypothetical protein